MLTADIGVHTDNTKAGRLAPLRKAVLYSIAVALMTYAGFALGAYIDPPYLREAVETIPVLLVLPLVLRLKPAEHQPMAVGLRVVLLMMPLPWVVMGIADFPTSILPLGAVAVLILLDAVAIGVSEEITFRFSLHRLLAPFGSVMYVAVSSVIFGVLHFPAGIEAVVFTALIGASWATARVAGMPILVLILVHAISSVPAP